MAPPSEGMLSIVGLALATTAPSLQLRSRPRDGSFVLNLRGGADGAAPPEDEGGLPLVPPPQDYSAASFDTAAAAAPPSSTLPLGVPSAAVCDAMISEGVAWASCNGMLMRRAEDSASFDHAPFSLLPAEFPAEQLELATELAPLFGTLVDRIAVTLTLTRTRTLTLTLTVTLRHTRLR